MAIARRLDGLSFFTKADFKTVVLIEGYNMQGTSGNFAIALAPEATPLIIATVTPLSVLEDENGIPLSMVQIFAPMSAIQAAKATIAASDPGADVPLYYEFRIDALPGDLGTPAETTLFYGTGHMRGSI